VFTRRDIGSRSLARSHARTHARTHAPCKRCRSTLIKADKQLTRNKNSASVAVRHGRSFEPDTRFARVTRAERLTRAGNDWDKLVGPSIRFSNARTRWTRCRHAADSPRRTIAVEKDWLLIKSVRRGAFARRALCVRETRKSEPA